MAQLVRPPAVSASPQGSQLPLIRSNQQRGAPPSPWPADCVSIVESEGTTARACRGRLRCGSYHRPMNAITLSWEDWRAVIAVMRAHGLPYELEHADHVEQLLEQHAPDEPMV